MRGYNLEFDLVAEAQPPVSPRLPLAHDLASFRQFGTATQQGSVGYRDAHGEKQTVTAYINEFWTAQQRQANRLHEISYRACFKPQLPRFFIERLTQPNDVVYDPFMGRGTTPVEAALLGRSPWGCDISPVSVRLTRPRLTPPLLDQVEERLKQIPWSDHDELRDDLLVFYHPETLKEICALKKYLRSRVETNRYDAVDDWINLIALNRLTGHSNGFFSVYTLPPNQAVSIQSQQRINERRNQVPPRRHVDKIILKKSRILLADCHQACRQTLARAESSSRLLTGPAGDTPEIPSGTVALVVTSPPFLNVVNYATDNWLRCWFLGIDPKGVEITMASSVPRWAEVMTGVFKELRRVLKPGGHIAFEVGEVDKGRIKLEETVLECGSAAGLEPVLVLINQQEFTKTANCWGVDNNAKGTNTNRVVVLRKRD